FADTKKAEEKVRPVEERALGYARSVARIAQAMENRFEVYTTVRQLRRFTSWYQKIAVLPPALTDLVGKIEACFPSDVKWSS
ncbi:hypothetical protein SB766_23940, partial [Pseudomonas sp. SIMBA_077]